MAKANSKIKPVHFNLDNKDDYEIYLKACTIENFTQWVKDRIVEDRLEKNKDNKFINREEIELIVKEILGKNEFVQEKTEIKVVQELEKKIEKVEKEKEDEIDSMMM